MKALLLTLLLCAPAFAQSPAARAVEAATHGLEAAHTSNLPGNIGVRFDILREHARRLDAGKGNLDLYLRYLSASRLVIWRSQPNGNVATALRQLEEASQAMAAAGGRNLDLPPVNGAAAATNAPMARTRLDPAQLLQTVRQADALAQQLLELVRGTAAVSTDPGAQRARQDMVGIAESTRNLRTAMEEGGANSEDRWQALEENRARFLYSQHRLPQLDERLAQLNEALSALLESWRP